jgi:DNA polymerase III epsilon subunit-like protein/tetratricopeptide (TPR) repeat protein
MTRKGSWVQVPHGPLGLTRTYCHTIGCEWPLRFGVTTNLTTRASRQRQGRRESRDGRSTVTADESIGAREPLDVARHRRQRADWRMSKEGSGGSSAFVAVDVETTGFSVGTDRVYEVAIIGLHAEGKETWTYQSLCRPPGALSRRLHPVDAAPSFEDIAGDVLGNLRGAPVIVGHNVTFDLEMLDAELRRLGAGLPEVKYLCTDDLALRLHLDVPNRRLSTRCHVLGVDVDGFHSAAMDARAAGLVLLEIFRIADERGLLDAARVPSTFAGSATKWPDLPPSGRAMVRDLGVLPPASRPSEDDTYTREPGMAVVDLDLASVPGVSERMAELGVVLARRRLRASPPTAEWPEEYVALVPDLDADDIAVSASAAGRLLQWLDDPTGELAAAEADFEDDGFIGERGVERLRRIISVFDGAGDPQVSEARPMLARLLRYEPGHGHGEVVAAYASAVEAARRLVDEDDEDLMAAAAGEWIDYLEAQRDVDGICALIAEATDFPGLEECLGLASFVHRLRAGGETAMACSAAAALSEALGDAGLMNPAGDVCAEWAQALAQDKRVDEALTVFGTAWRRGWASTALANRHSYILERQHRFEESIEVCDRGLALDPAAELLTARRARCAGKVQRT